MRQLLSALVLCSISLVPFAQADLQSLPEVDFQSFIPSGLNDPVRLVPSEDGNLFILEQAHGDVEIYDLAGVHQGKFLDVSSIISTGSERGLLGFAFHPDYLTNGKFYLNYTNTSGDTHISEWSVSANPLVADAASEVVLMTIDQDFSNHNGGHIAFGPDGYLYIGMGDGGSGNDPNGRAQDHGSLLGKMLRIEVPGTGVYTIPASNPFVADGSTEDEIWAIGVRNPWNFSFDSQTGDLWIGDVGQDSWEEIDFQPAASAGGENYGWRCWEGDAEHITSACSGITHTGPVAAHEHTGFSGWCSITGGAVYRGSDYPGMQGYYLYTDYCYGEIHAVKDDGAGGFDGYALNTTGNFGYTDIVEGLDGTMYIVNINGSVSKLVDNCNIQPELTLAGTDLNIDLAVNGYTWFVDGVEVPAETTAYLSPTTGGEYICLVDDAGCTRLSNPLTIDVVVGFPGCTYAEADNFDPSATLDNGSCTFSDGNACPEDLNGDGLVNTPDILALLGAFGINCND